MMLEDGSVRPGQTAEIVLRNGWKVALVGDGRVDPLIERGATRPADYLSAITAPRLEAFLRTREPRHLGAAWEALEESSNCLEVAMRTGGQSLSVDFKNRRVVLRTPYPSSVADASHAIEAKFDRKSGEIAVASIREFVLEPPTE
ncbi:MAG: hypothetical protein FJX76_07470 [Armatimonadetes bacterium]|nr:hypothetical protein [Armatimonadota bacterium]